MDYTEIVMQLVTAFLGSLGFALLFHVRREKLLLASLGGLLSWGYILPWVRCRLRWTPPGTLSPPWR